MCLDYEQLLYDKIKLKISNCSHCVGRLSWVLYLNLVQGTNSKNPQQKQISEVLKAQKMFEDKPKSFIALVL